MSTGREIRSYDYVNRPYERVRDALRQNALTVFQSATKAAASRAQSIAAEPGDNRDAIVAATYAGARPQGLPERPADLRVEGGG